MENHLEKELLELMNKDYKKFSEIIEKCINISKEKYNKEISLKSRNNLNIIDGSTISDYYNSLKLIDNWISKCIDEIRNYIKPLVYPIYVYLFFELILTEKWKEAKEFLKYFEKNFLIFQKEIDEFFILKSPLNKNIPLISKYLNNKIHIFVPKIIFNFFIHFLNTNKLILILDILNKYFERSDLLSKINNNNNSEFNKFILLNNSTEEIEKINSNTNIYYNKVNKDQIDKILSNKKTKGEKNILNKIVFPFPENLNEFSNYEIKSLKINKNFKPTIGLFTVLNTNNKLNCSDMKNDGGIIACGMNNGEIMIWVLDNNIVLEVTEKDIKNLEKYKDSFDVLIQNMRDNNNNNNNNINNDNNKENDNVNNNNSKEIPSPSFIYELITSRYRHFSLFGHTGSIFSISISPENDYIISGSFDGNVRLWNLHTKSCVNIYKNFSPILSVKFSPIGHYFVSGGCDNSIKLYAINSIGPLRIFYGHLSDVEIVDFHPNGLYVISSSNDKTIRLWEIKSGECCRIFVNYNKDVSYINCLTFSNSGKLLVIAVKNSIVIYDIVKMGDPVSIVENITEKNIISIAFDNDDNVIVISTEDYKIKFIDLDSILNSEDNLEIDCNKDKKVEVIYNYMTKKTTILNIKFTNSNLMLMLGRFDDNDPKIFT